MSKKMMFIGNITGVDRRVPKKWSRTISLRETKMFYVDENGTKYRKSDGFVTEDYPLYRLDISSVREKV